MKHDDIQVKTPNEIKNQQHKSCFVGCLILTHDNKLLLQQRGTDWHTFPGYVSAFGGRIEQDETPMQALTRELHEELGAKVLEEDVIEIGAITEAETNHTELVYEYFWHDKHGTITGCFEGEPLYFNNANEILTSKHKLMTDVRWLIHECLQRKLIKE